MPSAHRFLSADRLSSLTLLLLLPGTRLLASSVDMQEAIRQLQLCTTVESEELVRLGVKLELDERSGKLRVTRRDPTGAGSAAGPSAAGPTG